MTPPTTDTQATVSAIEALLPDDSQERVKLLGAFNFDSVVTDMDKKLEAAEPWLPRLEEALGDQTRACLIDLLASPKTYAVSMQEDGTRGYPVRIATLLAAFYVYARPSPDSAAALAERFRWMAGYGENAMELDGSHPRTVNGSPFLLPGPGECLMLLLAHTGMDAADRVLDELASGALDGPLSNGSTVYQRFANADSLRGGITRLRKLRYAEGKLDYDYYRQLAASFPSMTNIRSVPFQLNEHSRKEADYWAVHHEFGVRYLGELIDALPDSAEVYQATFGLSRHIGHDYIVRGVECIKALKLKGKDLKDKPRNALGGALRSLVGSALADGETQAALSERLAAFDARELLVALPHALHARDAILRALGWDDILPFQHLQATLGPPTLSAPNELADLPNSDDSSSGVVDYRWARELLTAADPARLDSYLDDLRAWGGVPSSLMIFDALRGHGREKLEKALKSSGQAAARAYGLLPVDGSDDVRNRFLKLKEIEKGAKKFGAERSANTRAAAQAGLRNLAQVAGYRDELHMAWDLEADLATAQPALGEWHEVEDWQVCLDLDGVDPVIAVEKGGKRLKSVPPKVRKHDTYKALREQQDGLREQSVRCARTLEHMMCTADPIDAAMLAIVARQPLLQTMLGKLVLRDADGHYGLPAFPDALLGVDGSARPLAAPLTIAHAHDLTADEVLADWQQQVEKAGIVQPFDQVQRALYVATDDEQVDRFKSARFAGKTVSSSKAAAVLKARGWKVQGDSSPQKVLPEQGVTAMLDFERLERYFTQTPTLTVADVAFLTRESINALSEVDPRVFSEIMRDVDLVVSSAAG
ncbi:MAG: DUF4132 domain-containing protein [Pseudomonadota bacterium]